MTNVVCHIVLTTDKTDGCYINRVGMIRFLRYLYGLFIFFCVLCASVVKFFLHFFVIKETKQRKCPLNSCVFLHCLAKAGAELEYSAFSLLLLTISAQL